jgi:hypothetical protein
MTKIDSAQGNHFVSWDSPSPGFQSLLAADHVGASFVRFAEIDSLLVKKIKNDRQMFILSSFTIFNYFLSKHMTKSN